MSSFLILKLMGLLCICFQWNVPKETLQDRDHRLRSEHAEMTLEARVQQVYASFAIRNTVPSMHLHILAFNMVETSGGVERKWREQTKWSTYWYMITHSVLMGKLVHINLEFDFKSHRLDLDASRGEGQVSGCIPREGILQVTQQMVHNIDTLLYIYM